MNLLKKITIDGQMEYGYAQIAAAYTFMHQEEETLSPRFVLPVPEGGQVLGFQFLNPKGRLVL